MRESADIFPADWDTKTIGDIACHIGSGATPTGGSSVYSKTGITFIRSQNVTFKGLLLDDVAFIGTSIHQQMARSEIFPHDVLLNITGASIGRCSFVPHNFGLANVNQHVCAIRLPKPSHEDAVFLAGVLASHIGQVQIDRLNAGGNREGLNYQQVRSFVVPWPEPEERKRIAAILEAADEAIAKTEAVIAKLKQVRAGLLHNLLTRGLDEHGQLRDPITHPEQFKDSPMGQIPKDWKVELLGTRLQQNAGFVQTGPFGSQLHANEYTREGVPVIMPQDISASRFVDENIARISTEKATELRRHRVESGDLIFARRGDLARCATVTNREVHWLCGTGCLLMRFKQHTLLPKWLSLIYQHDVGQRQIAARAVGTTMVNLNTQLLAHLLFAFPTKREQEAIVQHVDEADRTIEAEMLQLSKLTLLKSGLIADLLTGRVRVPEEIAVAS
jgi:type I restriction enzyme S subunit